VLVGVDSLGITKQYFLALHIGNRQLVFLGVDGLGITKQYFWQHVLMADNGKESTVNRALGGSTYPG
jgi:hypothetical protein